MRQVRGHGQHPIVVQGIHLVDHGAAGPPQRRDALDRLACTTGQGGEDHPAVLVQRRKARRWPRLLGTGNGVGRNEVHALGHVRLDIGDHRTLGGADVGDDAARREMRPDLFSQRGVGSDGGTQPQSAPTTASAASSVTLSASPSSRILARFSAGRTHRQRAGPIPAPGCSAPAGSRSARRR